MDSKLRFQEEIKRRVMKAVKEKPRYYDRKQDVDRLISLGKDFAVRCARQLSEDGAHEGAIWIYQKLGMKNEMEKEARLADNWVLLWELGMARDAVDFAKKKAMGGDFGFAAFVYESIGMHSEAIRMYHLANEHHEEFAIAKKHGLEIDVDQCISDLKGRRMFSSAAFLLRKAGREVEYARMLVKECQEPGAIKDPNLPPNPSGGRDEHDFIFCSVLVASHGAAEKALEVFLKHGLVEDAAGAYEKLYRHEDAAKMFEKAGMIDKARELYVRYVASKRIEAIHAYIEDGKTEKLIEIAEEFEANRDSPYCVIYERIPHPAQIAAVIYELLGSIEKAIDCYSQAGNWWAAAHLAKLSGEAKLQEVIRRRVVEIEKGRMYSHFDNAFFFSAFGRVGLAREQFNAHHNSYPDKFEFALKLGLKEEATDIAILRGEYKAAEELMADKRHMHSITYEVEYGNESIISIRFNDRVWDYKK